MYPLHDNDLDRLSREAAEHYHVEPGASGWEQLEKRLDQELPGKKDRRRFLFWLFFIGIATGGGLTALLKNNQPVFSLAKNTITVPVDNEPTGNRNSTTTNSPHTTSGEHPPATLPSAVPGNNPGQLNPGPAEVGPAPVTPATVTPDNKLLQPGHHRMQPLPYAPGGNGTTATGVLPATTNGKNISSDYTATPRHPGIPRKKQWTSNNYPGVEQQRNDPRIRITDEAPHVAKDKRTNIAVLRDKKPDTQAPQASHQPVINNTNDLAEPANDSAATTAVPEKAVDQQPSTAAIDSSMAGKQPPADNKKTAPKKDHTIKQPWELGLVGGPDISTVAFGAPYSTGINLGVQIGYRFSNRWSVNTGIIYTKKFYQADGQYYHGKLPWPGMKVDEIEGNCSMLDIPVNVRYDVSFNAKRRVFVSAGLSTYLMDQEDYTLYYYYSGGSQVRPWGYKSNTNSQYLFSIANLSAGFEKSLGKKMSIQVEPYLKIPLTGLGYGNMRMDSYGIFFSLKYKPSFHTKNGHQ